MAHVVPEHISNFVEDHFPEIFKENNSEIVQFILAYYEWLEQSGQTTKVLRDLHENRDIDSTVSDFLIHFRKTFIQGTQLQTTSDERFMLKHISDLYQSKGSIRSIEMLIKLLYGEEVDVTLPSERVIIPSESRWYKPTYLEVSPSDRTKGFIGKQITGSASGASAFVESVITKVIKGKIITVLFLSGKVGNFETGEFITDDGLLDDAPQMVGSLSSISVVNGGRNFAIGDEFDVISDGGVGGEGKAKITSVIDATGRVDYNLANGGYGYTVSNTYTRSLSSNATLVINNITNTDANVDNFFLFENVSQPLAEVTWTSGNADFISYANTSGNKIQGANTTGNIVANGYWVATGSGNTITIITHEGNFADADYLYSANAATNVAIDTVSNTTAIGEYIGGNTTIAGINANNKPFYKGDYTFLVGGSSNTYANVANVGSGVGGDFEVGTLGSSEVLTLFTDIIGANNTAEDDKPYSNVIINGANSGIGFVDSITIDTGITIDSVANSGTPFAANGDFSVGDYIFECNLVVNSVVVTNAGSGYVNSDTVVFTGSAATNAVANVVTDGSGGIQGIEISNNGIDYELVPAITITTSTGSGATLVAKMKASGNSIGAVGTIKTVTNSTHIVVRNVSNGSFTNGRTITNEGVNAFANVSSAGLLAGSGYVNSDTVSISGGNPNVSATASFSANSSNSGSVDSITIIEPGTEYLSNASVSISTSTGTGASISVNMDFGYGLPKSGQADLTTILYNALTFSNFTIGTIESLNGINPGSGYNLDPVTLVHNPYVAGFNRRDLICVIDNRTGSFNTGENLTQTLSLPGFLVQHSNSTSNGITLNANSDAITIGEGVVQLTTNASGVVESSNSTHIKISNPVGTFTDAYTIQTQTSGANVVPLTSGVTQNTVSAIATGRYKSISTVNGIEQIKIRRLNFGQSFVANATLTGASSGATANVVYAYQDDETLPIGLNAVVNATVITANGVAQTIEITNSGYGYEDGDTVQLSAANSAFIVTGTANVLTQGVGAGYWRDRVSFASDVNKIHDNDYYQEYSYVVKTGIALAKYEDQLKEILHVAGTKLFGEVIKVRVSDTLELSSTGVTVSTS